MFDIDHLMKLGVFNQSLIPIWQIFFFIASLLPFLLLNRVKICLLITYPFSDYSVFSHDPMGVTTLRPPDPCSPLSSIR